MIDYKIFNEINEICSWMEDKESEIILKQRFLYSLTNKIQYIYDMLKFTGFSLEMLDGAYEKEIHDMYGDSLPREDLLTFLMRRKAEKVVIFGCGVFAEEIVKVLVFAGYSIYAFTDNYKQGEYLGYPIVNVKEIPQEAFIIISSLLHRDDMYKQLIGLGYKNEQIFYPGENMLFCPYGTSYFDNTIFKPEDESIFIDGGCFHGETSKRFASWAKSYKGIVAFEPDACNYEISKHNLEGLKSVTLLKAGLYSENTQLTFGRAGIDGSGSHIMENGSEQIEVNTLDSIVGEKVSFIKLDVEGTELNALKGGRKIIKRDKPKMAICLYHRPEDIWEIPRFVKDLVPEYHMAVRHYMTYCYDTILYCWV